MIYLSMKDKKFLIGTNTFLFFMIIILGLLVPLYQRQFYWYDPGLKMSGFDEYYPTAYMIAFFVAWFTLWYFYIWTLTIGIIQKNNFYFCLFMLPFISTLKWNTSYKYNYNKFLSGFSVSFVICGLGLIASIILPFFVSGTKVDALNHIGQVVISTIYDVCLLIGLAIIYGIWVGTARSAWNLVSSNAKEQLPIKQ